MSEVAVAAVVVVVAVSVAVVVAVVVAVAAGVTFRNHLSKHREYSNPLQHYPPH